MPTYPLPCCQPSTLTLTWGNNFQSPKFLDHLPPLLQPKGLTLLFMSEHCSPFPGSLSILPGFQAIRALLMERGSGLG